MKHYPEWRLRYNTAHYNYTLQRTPNVIRDGFYTGPTLPKVATANGLTQFICNFLSWTGSHGERTNNMGVPVVKKIPKMNIFSGKVEHKDGGIEWRKGTGIKGTSDIKGHIKNDKHKFPIPFYVEIKIGRDKKSNDQILYDKMITKTGAMYSVIKTPQDWFAFYDHVIQL